MGSETWMATLGSCHLQSALGSGLQVAVLHWVSNDKEMNGDSTDLPAHSSDTHFWPRETGSLPRIPPGQICATHQQRTLPVFTSPNATPVWILFSVPTRPPTLWEWPKKQGYGGRVSGGKVTLQNCSRSASLTLKSSMCTVYKSILTANHSREFDGENWESFITGNETFTLYIGHSCIWRSKITVKFWDNHVSVTKSLLSP